MLGYLSADIICFEKRTVFRERSSRKTVSYEEQIMSKDEYPSISSPQMATIVFIILQIFFATCTVLKIGEYSRIFPSFSRGIFGHVTRLGQSRVSKKIWWIMIRNILTLTECVVLYGYHNSIKNKQALNVTVLLAKYHIFATSSFDGKLSFESFLLRLQNHLEILKQSYTAANKSRQFFFYIWQSVVIQCFAPFPFCVNLTKIDVFASVCFAFVLFVTVFFYPYVRLAL